MTDLALFHVKTVRDGEADFMDHDRHSRVRYDGRTYYYNLDGLNTTADEFAAWVCDAWSLFDEGRVDVGTCGAPDVFCADIE